MNTYSVVIDWPAIHEAAKRVDEARRGHRLIGYIEPCADVFGGTYYGPHYERQGVPGAVRLVEATRVLARQCWDIIHQGSRRIEKSPSREVRVEMITRTQAALETAVALHELRSLLAGAGLMTYCPTETICGVTADGRIRVTGMRWIKGQRVELEGEYPTIDEARQIFDELRRKR